MTDLFRSLAAGEVELRSDGDGRTLEGLFVPYGKPTRIDATLTEEFVPGAFARQARSPGRVPLALGHLPHGGTAIGRVIELREDSRGLFGRARVSATRDGDDALELLRDGVYDSLSIGFREGQNARTAAGVIQRKTATLTEIAIVHQPAYAGAKVLALRSGEACPTCGAAAAAAHERSNLEQAAQILAALPVLPAVSR